jgi:hypothetical protein
MTDTPNAAVSANSSTPFYVASDIKRRFRRTKAEITVIKKSIIDILSNDNPQTVRQVFYALTVRGVIKKAEIEYQRTSTKSNSPCCGWLNSPNAKHSASGRRSCGGLHDRAPPPS